MYTASVQVVPIKVEDLTKVIDEVVDVIKKSGLKYEVNAHSTVVEGELGDIIKLAQEISKRCLEVCERCVFTLQIDLKRGGVRIDEKVGRYRVGRG